MVRAADTEDAAQGERARIGEQALEFHNATHCAPEPTTPSRRASPKLAQSRPGCPLKGVRKDLRLQDGRRIWLSRFAQATRRGAYRYLLLCLSAFTLTQWQVWEAQGAWPDWGAVTTTARRELVPGIILTELTSEMERLQPYLKVARTPVET